MRLCADFHARSVHVIWFLTTWVTVENSSKCVFVPISMLGREKKSHYSSCFTIENFVTNKSTEGIRNENKKELRKKKDEVICSEEGFKFADNPQPLHKST